MRPRDLKGGRFVKDEGFNTARQGVAPALLEVVPLSVQVFIQANCDVSCEVKYEQIHVESGGSESAPLCWY